MNRPACLLMSLAMFALGCTMAPDPFDYSGPVPNGSVTQNNFAARSNGILPLHASPKPWPIIVKDGTNNESSGAPSGALTIASYDVDDATPDTEEATNTPEK